MERSQIGTVKEGPAEYFSSRMTNKERKKTLVDELLVADDAFRCSAPSRWSILLCFEFFFWGGERVLGLIARRCVCCVKGASLASLIACPKSLSGRSPRAVPCWWFF